MNMVPEYLLAEAEERCRQLVTERDAGYKLSTWAATINWDGTGNTAAWLDGLRERIERVQQLHGTNEEAGQ